MYVMQISKHSPESCPTVNESTVKVTVDLIKNLDSLAAKHGMKLVGSWTDHPMHMIYNIYETPNMEAFFSYCEEPECIAWLGYNTVETKVVQSLQDVKEMFNIE